MSRAVVLHPGDVACGERGDRLETLLGSCIAIVLTDPRRTVGTMCHVVHTGESDGGRGAADSHYGQAALQSMFRQLVARGITPRLCQAYVYGGGNMFPALMRGGHVGERNARWARDALEAAGVRVLVHDVGGSAYRKLAWTIGPGDPEVRAMPVQEEAQ